VEGDGGQMAHPNAPTDLPWPNRSVARLMSGYDRAGFVPSRQQDFCQAAPVADDELAKNEGRSHTRKGASDYPCNARFSASIWKGFLRVGRSR
jgi:hypothetical protein